MIYQKDNLVLRSEDDLVYRCNDCPCGGGYYLGFFCSARVTGTDRNYLGQWIYNEDDQSMTPVNYPIPDNPFSGSDGVIYIIPADQAYYGEANGKYLILFECPAAGPSVFGESRISRATEFPSRAAAQNYMAAHDPALIQLAAEHCRVCSFRFWNDYLRIVGENPDEQVNTIDVTFAGQTFKLKFTGFTNNGSFEQTADDLLDSSAWCEYRTREDSTEEYLPEISEENPGKSYEEILNSGIINAGSLSFPQEPGLLQVATFDNISSPDYWNPDAASLEHYIPEGMLLASWEPVQVKLDILLHVGASRSDWIGYTDQQKTYRNYFLNRMEVSFTCQFYCYQNGDYYPVTVTATKFQRHITRNSLLLTLPQGKTDKIVAGVNGPWILDSSWDPRFPKSGEKQFYEWRNQLTESPTWEQILQHVPEPDWIIGFTAANTADRITLIYYRDAVGGDIYCSETDISNMEVPVYSIDRIYWENRISTDCNGGTPLDYFMNDELPEEFE